MEKLSVELVKLVECARRGCGHILTEEEYEWRPGSFGKTAVCPLCFGETFYRLKANGRRMTPDDTRHGPEKFDPATIAPCSKLGLKKQMGLLDVKRRVLGL